MVAVTGDLVDGSVPQLRSHVAPLGDLTSRHGTYFVTGNHEYYSGVAAWVSELRGLGVNVLLNEHVVLWHNDDPLVIAGVTDYSSHHFDESHRSDAAAAIASAPEGVVRILLAHQPRSAEGALQAGFDLQLSGHTHGGQFWPWNFFVRFSSRSLRDCIGLKVCGSIQAVALDTGGRPSDSARRLKSRAFVWCRLVAPPRINSTRTVKCACRCLLTHPGTAYHLPAAIHVFPTIGHPRVAHARGLIPPCHPNVLIVRVVPITGNPHRVCRWSGWDFLRLRWRRLYRGHYHRSGRWSRRGAACTATACGAGV